MDDRCKRNNCLLLSLAHYANIRDVNNWSRWPDALHGPAWTADACDKLLELVAFTTASSVISIWVRLAITPAEIYQELFQIFCHSIHWIYHLTVVLVGCCKSASQKQWCGLSLSVMQQLVPPLSSSTHYCYFVCLYQTWVLIWQKTKY